MMRALVFAAALLCWLSPAQAQSGAKVVTTCGTAPATYPVGSIQPLQIDQNGNLCGGQSTTQAIAGAVNVTPIDCSGTIATGGTAQNAFAAQTTLHGFTIANIDASAGSGEPLWISFTGTATAAAVGSYPLAAPAATFFSGLSSYSAPLGFGVNTALSVVAATTGHKYSCTRW